MAATSTASATPLTVRPVDATKRKGQVRKAEQVDINFEELRTTIKQQSKYIRHLKRQGADKEEILRQAHRLLDLKYLDPENLEVVDPKVVKIRWMAPKADGSTVRLQYPFHARTYVLGSEVAEAIEAYTTRVAAKKQLVSIGSLVKLDQLILKDGRNRRVAVLPSSRFELDIVNPGPTLEDERVFSFEATWSVPNASPVYHLLDHVPQLIDTGVNLFDRAFAKDKNAIVQRATAVGVSQMLLLSTTHEDSAKNIEQAGRNLHSQFAAVGIHPNWATKVSPDAIKEIDELLAKSPRDIVVAVGEIGLDLSSKGDDSCSNEEQGKEADASEAEPAEGGDVVSRLQRQIDVFTAQLELAVKYQLPVIVHIRDANEHALPILQRFRPQLKNAMIFCFSEDEAALRAYIELDCYIAITGLVCNDARGAGLRSILHLIPKERLLVASDAPYLAPFSHLPKPYPKFNEPSLLPYIALAVAEYSSTDLSVSDLARITTENARRFFDLPSPIFTGSKPSGASSSSSFAASSSSSTAAAPVASSSTASQQPEKINKVKSLLEETASAHQNLDLDKIDDSNLVRLKPGQCYFAHKDQTFAVSLQIAGILKKQRDLLGEDSPAFDALVKDLIQM